MQDAAWPDVHTARRRRDGLPARRGRLDHDNVLWPTRRGAGGKRASGSGGIIWAITGALARAPRQSNPKLSGGR